MTAPVLTADQQQLLNVIAGWLDDEVKVLMRSGLSHEEAARAHNRTMKRYRVDVLLTRLVNGLGVKQP